MRVNPNALTMGLKNLLLLLLLLLGFHKVFAIEDDKILLARIVFAEAAGEFYSGKVAVGWVVRNRVESKKFPNTYWGVIFQRTQFPGVSSNLWKLTYDLKKMTPYQLSMWQDCLKIAQDVIEGKVSDPTGADHYYNPSLASPSWAKKMTQVKKIGNHLFLKS